jgi:hypothetical protein
VSAVEEYREHRALVGCETEHGLRICINKADAAIAELEAELEALKARRCGGCKHWHGHNYCAEGIAEECDVPELPDHDFACNRWTPREAAE